jgi:NADPH:quinone reductase-like Zn-dependent oxidoreductase
MHDAARAVALETVVARIIRFYQAGGPEVLRLEETAAQRPGSGEVLLRVQAAGLNRAEALFMRGQEFGPPAFPSRIGCEGAGVVEDIGPDVDCAWLGKRVATLPGFSMYRHGVLGEEAIVPVNALGEYPPVLSPTEGAAIWMQYLTAWGALVHVGKVTRGDYVLIRAASSSVGVAAIQTVNDAGGIPIAATRTAEKRTRLLEFGAHHVIATGEEDLVARVNQITAGRGARLILDPVGGPEVEMLAEACAVGGVLFIFGGLSKLATPFPTVTSMRKGMSMRGYSMREFRDNALVLAAAKAFIGSRLEDGSFTPTIARTFPLEHASDAYRYLESNAQVGKVVITV